MARKKIKLEEEAISEILVADTNSESGAEASNVEDYFEKEEEEDEEEEQQQQQQASTEVAIINIGQRNQHDCAAICVLLTAKERAHRVPDVMWACSWCLVLQNITQK